MNLVYACIAFPFFGLGLLLVAVHQFTIIGNWSSQAQHIYLLIVLHFSQQPLRRFLSFQDHLEALIYQNFSIYKSWQKVWLCVLTSNIMPSINVQEVHMKPLKQVETAFSTLFMGYKKEILHWNNKKYWTIYVSISMSLEHLTEHKITK